MTPAELRELIAGKPKFYCPTCVKIGAKADDDYLCCACGGACGSTEDLGHLLFLPALLDERDRLAVELEAVRKAYDNATRCLAIWKARDIPAIRIDTKTGAIERMPGGCLACNALDAALADAGKGEA